MRVAQASKWGRECNSRTKISPRGGFGPDIPADIRSKISVSLFKSRKKTSIVAQTFRADVHDKTIQPAPKYHTKGCSRSSVDCPGARTLVFAAFEPFSSCEFRAPIARTPFCAILWSETSKRHLKRQQPQSNAKSDANLAAIVQFLTCHFTVVAFCGRCTILQKSSFHGC